MTASAAAKLYTPELLSLATELATYPLTADLALRGEARSKTCGSTVEMGLGVSREGAVTDIGMRVSACAVGQAAAALFARSAKGRTLGDLQRAEEAIRRWLAGAGPAPAWPGLPMLVPAREHASRHGAILLPWKAAVIALSSPSVTS